MLWFRFSFVRSFVAHWEHQCSHRAFYVSMSLANAFYLHMLLHELNSKQQWNNSLRIRTMNAIIVSLINASIFTHKIWTMQILWQARAHLFTLTTKCVRLKRCCHVYSPFKVVGRALSQGISRLLSICHRRLFDVNSKSESCYSVWFMLDNLWSGILFSVHA